MTVVGDEGWWLRALKVVKAPAGAGVNRVFAVVCDSWGSERGVDWIGGQRLYGLSAAPVPSPRP